MLAEVAKFTKFLRRKRPDTSTCYHYTNALKLFFAWADKPPAAITVRDVDRYIDHCHLQGHAIKTINRRLTALRSFYDFLELDSDEAPTNPIIPRRHFIDQGDRLPRDVEDADIAQLFTVVHDERDRAIYLLMLRCGLRVGEVHTLSLSDLYLRPSPNNLPRVRVCGKKNSRRVVYLSHEALIALEVWLAVRPETDSEAVFLNYKGQRLSIRGMQKRLARYCRQAGISITCHQFRHTLGRHLVEANMPVTSIQKLFGHKRLRTTQLYTQISDQKVQADYDAAIAEIPLQLASVGGDE